VRMNPRLERLEARIAQLRREIARLEAERRKLVGEGEADSPADLLDTLRARIAQRGLGVGEVAAVAGVRPTVMGSILAGRARLTGDARSRIEAWLEETAHEGRT
jgi:hypothetical protein